MNIKLFKTYLKLKIIRLLTIWLSLCFVFGLVLSFFIDVERAALISLIVILPLVPPVHLNNYFIDHFFLKRKYWQYFVLLTGLLVVFGFVAQLLMDIFHNTEGEYIGAMFNPFAAVLVTSGIKGFREYLQNNYNVLEARARQAEAELKLSETESKQIRAELDLLKAQVNPHFLFNTLNSIYSLSLDHSANTPKAIMLLSKLMRYHLETSKAHSVLLSDEVAFIKSYIELEKLRLNRKCIINFDIAGVKDTHCVPPLLLLPLVENCFKHGISIEKKKNVIYIKITIKDNILRFNTINSITEDKSEYPDDKNVKTGIANIKRRLKLLHDNKYKFESEKRDGKFYTNLIIEL